mgnify:CR=1 FL=1
MWRGFWFFLPRAQRRFAAEFGGAWGLHGPAKLTGRLTRKLRELISLCLAFGHRWGLLVLPLVGFVAGVKASAGDDKRE